MKYTIRQTRRLDLIARLDVETHPWDVWGTDRLAEHTWWVAKSAEGSWAGLSGAKMRAEELILAWAVVMPEHRGHGLQARFIRKRLEWGCKQGAEIAITYTLANNTPSINNLIRCGFTVYDPEWAWVGREGILYWQRTL